MLCPQCGSYSLRCFQCSHVIFLFLFVDRLPPSSPPLPCLWSRSPGGITGDHSVTDRPWGARSTVYNSFGVNASCLLQFPLHYCTSRFCPALVPTQYVHIYYTLLYTGGVGQSVCWQINTLVAQDFNLYVSHALFKQTYSWTCAHKHTCTN